MKKILQTLLISFAALSFAACEGNGGEDTPPTPGNGYYEFPLNEQKDGFTAKENGVTINVSSVVEQNIVFNLVPGSSITSYRLAVYPKAMLYNLLLNEGKVDQPTEACYETIITLLESSTLIGNDDDEFNVKEFDWANSAYAQGPIIPACEYFILALGCYDTAGQNPASLSIALVETPAQELVGDPQIGIEAEVGYSAFIVRYHPNEDCKYFYHWIWTTDEIGEYIDLFGEKLMADFCRTAASEAYDASLEENLTIKRTFAASENLNKENTAVAVALDANMTPSHVIMRNDFRLLDTPEGDFAPKAKIEAADRIGATLAYLNIEMEKNCMSCFYRVYTAEEAAAIKDLGADDRKAIATSIANEGWGVANTNFSFNTDLETLTGDAFKSTEQEHLAELKPDSEYVVVYVAKNYFQELSDLCFSEPFRTKTLTVNNPESCTADINLYFTDISRWGFTYNFEYDYSNTAAFRFQLVYPYDETSEIIPPHYINDKDNREKWMTFFYDTYVYSPAGFDTPIVNVWTAERSGYDGYSMYGYDSGITYVFAYCAEDINGVVGPVKFVEVSTTEANPGPNPTIAIEDMIYDEENGMISGRFVANEDTKMVKYFGVSSSEGSLFSSCALNDLVNGNRRDYNAYLTLWEGQLIELGLSSNAESVVFGVSCEKVSDSPVLIAAIAIGEENGEDVYSPIACSIYHKGEFKSLADYRTPPTE